MVRINVLKEGWTPDKIWETIEKDLKKPGDFTYYFSLDVFKQLLYLCNSKKAEQLIFGSGKKKIEVHIREVINRTISANGYDCFKLRSYSVINKVKYRIDNNSSFYAENILFVNETENLKGKVDTSILMENEMI